MYGRDLGIVDRREHQSLLDWLATAVATLERDCVAQGGAESTTLGTRAMRFLTTHARNRAPAVQGWHFAQAASSEHHRCAQRNSPKDTRFQNVLESNLSCNHSSLQSISCLSGYSHHQSWNQHRIVTRQIGPLEYAVDEQKLPVPHDTNDVHPPSRRGGHHEANQAFWVEGEAVFPVHGELHAFAHRNQQGILRPVLDEGFDSCGPFLPDHFPQVFPLHLVLQQRDVLCSLVISNTVELLNVCIFLQSSLHSLAHLHESRLGFLLFERVGMRRTVLHHLLVHASRNFLRRQRFHVEPQSCLEGNVGRARV
mmetsp:Transcript_51424/g.104642  ORF Transcript_51424/g.104642 Transcript_51424/m.104642 type:complete len:310 (+) Transcript_51424:16-945(+)